MDLFMLPNFEKIGEPEGVPVFLQQLPDIVNPASVQMAMFTGSNDDTAVGKPGLYHWFEHVPFRGTQRFPQYKDTKHRFSRQSGSVGAYTSSDITVFRANIQRAQWADALELTTDLVSAPLLRDDAINAERDVIRQEIAGSLSDIHRRIWMEIASTFWHGHPRGHPTLGTEETLDAMDAEMLRNAHRQGYDKSRASVVFSGHLEKNAVLDACGEILQRLPDQGIPERRKAASHGLVPPWEPGTTTVDVPFPSSLVLTAFNAPANASRSDLSTYSLLGALVSSGADSPLMKILREERKLVYSAWPTGWNTIDGGFWGIAAQTKANTINDVREAMKDVLSSSELRSRERFDYVRDIFTASMTMRTIDPSDFADEALGQLKRHGCITSFEERLATLLAVTHDEIVALVETLTPESGHTIVLKGTA
jgi:predicted Zn-dependent peptidase